MRNNEAFEEGRANVIAKIVLPICEKSIGRICCFSSQSNLSGGINKIYLRSR